MCHPISTTYRFIITIGVYVILKNHNLINSLSNLFLFVTTLLPIQTLYLYITRLIIINNSQERIEPSLLIKTKLFSSFTDFSGLERNFHSIKDQNITIRFLLLIIISTILYILLIKETNTSTSTAVFLITMVWLSLYLTSKQTESYYNEIKDRKNDYEFIEKEITDRIYDIKNTEYCFQYNKKITKVFDKLQASIIRFRISIDKCNKSWTVILLFLLVLPVKTNSLSSHFILFRAAEEIANLSFIISKAYQDARNTRNNKKASIRHIKDLTIKSFKAMFGPSASTRLIGTPTFISRRIKDLTIKGLKAMFGPSASTKKDKGDPINNNKRFQSINKTPSYISIINSGSESVLLLDKEYKEFSTILNNQYNSVSSYIGPLPLYRDSIKGTITLNQPYCDKRYKQVLDVTSIEKFILQSSRIPEKEIHHDRTFLTLVGIASCLYKDAEIYILNHPFIEIDSSIASKIDEKGLRGLLKNKRVALLTRKEYFPNHSDVLFYLEEKRTHGIKTNYSIPPKTRRNVSKKIDNEISLKKFIEMYLFGAHKKQFIRYFKNKKNQLGVYLYFIFIYGIYPFLINGPNRILSVKAFIMNIPLLSLIVLIKEELYNCFIERICKLISNSFCDFFHIEEFLTLLVYSNISRLYLLTIVNIFFIALLPNSFTTGNQSEISKNEKAIEKRIKDIQCLYDHLYHFSSLDDRKKYKKIYDETYTEIVRCHRNIEYRICIFSLKYNILYLCSILIIKLLFILGTNIDTSELLNNGAICFITYLNLFIYLSICNIQRDRNRTSFYTNKTDLKNRFMNGLNHRPLKITHSTTSILFQNKSSLQSFLCGLSMNIKLSDSITSDRNNISYSCLSSRTVYSYQTIRSCLDPGKEYKDGYLKFILSQIGILQQMNSASLGLETPFRAFQKTLGEQASFNLQIAYLAIKQPKVLVVYDINHLVDMIEFWELFVILKNLLIDTTIIYLTTEISNVFLCDHFYWIVDDSIVEEGKPYEISSRKGTYLNKALSRFWKSYGKTGSVSRKFPFHLIDTNSLFN
eukprot:GHVP01054859.1.p1 GENE.GHVP01054859.1~~GHVP01054859.1.p1  ORF type:complete len:1033 (+),score=122.71 GHVP01054859.1:1271-4369(+)